MRLAKEDKLEEALYAWFIFKKGAWGQLSADP